MSKNNSMSSIKNDDFMTSDFSNRDFHLGSPTLMRTFLPSTPSHNNGGEQRFSTRYKTIFSENVIPSAGLFLPVEHRSYNRVFKISCEILSPPPHPANPPTPTPKTYP